MIFICKNILKKFAFMFSIVIFLCVLVGHCYGVDRDKVYHSLLTAIDSINKEHSINTIVLHGSVAWRYIIADTNNDQLILQNMKINDLDFFVNGELFEEVIETLRGSMRQLSFEIRTAERDNFVWCFCYFRTENGRAVRVADFVKLDNEFPLQDVLCIQEEKFNLSIAKAPWILTYEQRWLNNLNTKILGYIDIIRESGNKWLALSGNSDNIYSIYKAFNKFYDHIAMFEQINSDNKIPFIPALEAQLISAKSRLDNIIRNTNIFLASNFGIDKAEQKKNAEKPTQLDSSTNKDRYTYAEIASKTVPNSGYNKLRTTKRNMKRQGKKHKRASESTDIAMLRTDLTHKMSLNATEHCALPKKPTKNKQGNNITKQRFHHQEKHTFNGVDSVLTMTNSFNCLSINEEENSDPDSDSDSDFANPFTPSFSKKEFYTKVNTEEVNYSTILKQFFTSPYARIRNICLLFILTLYFGHHVPTDAIIETAGMLVTDISELMFSLLSFAMNSESNWIITLPAVYAFITFKYKNKKRHKARAAALALLMPAYLSVYTYKFITGYNNKVELCPLPNWITKIKHIPRYTYIDPITHKKLNTNSRLLTPTEWITPDKLTCKNLVDLNKALKSAAMDESEFKRLEICGLIDNADFSWMCYTNDWEKYQLNIDLIESQSERCNGRDLCVSSKALIGRLNSQHIAGHQICCVENHGECSLPDSYFDAEINGTKSFKLTLSELKDTKHNLNRYIPFDGENIHFWKVLVESFSGGESVVLDNIPETGIYSVTDARTQSLELLICIVNKKISIARLGK
ncbi:MAG: hypothetical protein QS748_07780 [Candidatus Endonucleobacter bathymodioli]|uniref:Uncharacterized protein n=1 Tax=Candidatus Endonucleibacter bathymodioli TaxID=539814 RepID=A0AA90NLA7_9GAMM|nr:hypothetical protein [Candidatus Endonucleobacter bathymodioli]